MPPKSSSARQGAPTSAHISSLPTPIPVSEPDLTERELAHVVDCLKSGWISSRGVYIGRFEEDFAKFVGTKKAIAVSNGTCALHLALLAFDIGPGDEVIVPTFTFIASANAVRYTGATPVFVDMETDTWNADVAKIEKAITKRTKAIMPVHLYGHPCDMDAVNALAKKHKLKVIEDAAEAFGSLYKGKPIGGLGDIGVFSLFGNKTITTGEGGMVVTNDAKLDEKIRLLKGQGMSTTKQYYFTVLGYNYRMTNVQAAIGVAQMERAEELVARKRENADRYRRALAGIDEITLAVEKEYATNTYWMFSIVLNENAPIERDALIAELVKRGIETRPFFYPCHLMPPHFLGPGKFPISESISARGINLPSSTKLTAQQIQSVSNALKSILCSK